MAGDEADADVKVMTRQSRKYSDAENMRSCVPLISPSISPPELISSPTRADLSISPDVDFGSQKGQKMSLSILGLD